MHLANIVMTIAMAFVYSNGVLAAAVPNIPQVNEDTAIESADAAVKNHNSNGFLRGLKNYEGGAATDEERVFLLDNIRAVLADREKVARAKELIANHAPIEAIVAEGINPKQVFRALGLKVLGSHGRLTYKKYKVLRGEKLAKVLQKTSANDQLAAKKEQLYIFELAYARAH